MNWKKQYLPKELGIDVEETGDLIKNWYNAGEMIARKHNFSIIEEKSFIYMITSFMTNKGISDGTEEYIREETLKRHLIEVQNDFQQTYDDKEAASKFLEYLTNLYNYEIEDWTYKNTRLHIRPSENMFIKFKEIEGETNIQKLNFLINFYREYR